MPEHKVAQSSKGHRGNGTRRVQLVFVVPVFPDVIQTVFIPGGIQSISDISLKTQYKFQANCNNLGMYNQIVVK